MSTDILNQQTFFNSSSEKSLEQQIQEDEAAETSATKSIIMDIKSYPSSEDIHRHYNQQNNSDNNDNEDDEVSSNSSGEDLSLSESDEIAAANGNTTTTTNHRHSNKLNTPTNQRRNTRSGSSSKPYINRTAKCVRNPVTLVEEYSSSPSMSSYTNSSSLSTENIFSIIKEIEDAVNSCSNLSLENLTFGGSSNDLSTSANNNNIPSERPGRKLSISASSLPVVLLPASTSVPPIALSASAPSLPQSVIAINTTTTTSTNNQTTSPSNTTDCNDINNNETATISNSNSSGPSPSKKSRLFNKFKKSKSTTSSPIPKSPSTPSINPSTSSSSSQSDDEEVEDDAAAQQQQKKEKKKWKLSVKKKSKKPHPPIPLDLDQPTKPQSLTQSHSNIKTLPPTTTTTTSTTTSTTTTTTTNNNNNNNQQDLNNSKNTVETTSPSESEELESNHEINTSNNDNNVSPIISSPSPSLLSSSMPMSTNGENALNFYLELDNNLKGNSFGGQGILDLMAEEEEMPKGGRGRSNAFYMKGPPAIVNGEVIIPPTPPTLAPKPPSPRSDSSDSMILPKESSSLMSKPIGILSKFKKSSRTNKMNGSGSRVVKHHSSRFMVGFADTIGRRPNMEDETVIYGTFRGHIDEDYFALFDGHGGSEVAKLAAAELHKHLSDKLKANHNPVKSLKESFVSFNKTVQDKNMRGGTTAVVALFLGKKGYVANVGDSRAVLCRDGIAVRVSNDHKPHDPKEEERIKSLGGTVVTTHNAYTGVTTSRVNGQLAVSRALGDLILAPLVSCDPDVFGPINLETHIKNQFMIIACDGIWDVMTDDEAISIVAPIADPEKACMKLREIAFNRRSTDNISVMVIRFPPFD